uniref:Uncharacterized protein n=1 Tax=Tanacetum cinerariifolium TaxID=118510 RepID=A0A6L2M071_TANCI|nr:hypothetical protein [Tanacetum cinerariifolium]
MNILREIKSQFKFLTETLQDFGTMPIFKRTFSQDLDLLEQHLTKDILSRTDCKTILTKLITTFENAFNLEFKERVQKYTKFDVESFKYGMIYNMDSIGKYMLEIILHQQRTPHLLKQKKLMQKQIDHSNPIQALNIELLKVDLVVIQNTCSEKEDTNSETASSKSVKESILDSATKDVHEIKYKMSEAKERCMAYFRSLHSHLQVLSKEDLKGTRIEHGFKRAFVSLFGQDANTFTSTMLLNIDQLQKQLDKDEFLEDGSMAAFCVVNNQFQKFIDSQFSLDYVIQMTDNYFVEYTGIETQESKIDTGKEVNDDLVVTESSRTKSKVQDDNSRSVNDTDADDADIRPIYDKEPMAEMKLGKRHKKKTGTQKLVPSARFQSNADVQASNLNVKRRLNITVQASLLNVKNVPSVNMIAMTLMIELESLFGHLFDEYSNEENQVVSKSSVVTTADASDKRQQQADSTSSTSTLATTITADGNFDVLSFKITLCALEIRLKCHGEKVAKVRGVVAIAVWLAHKSGESSYVVTTYALNMSDTEVDDDDAKDDDGLDDKGAEDDKNEDEDDDPFFVVTINQHNFKGSFLYILNVGDGTATRCISGVLILKYFLYPCESSADNPRERKRQTGFGWNLKSLDVAVVTKMVVASDAGHDNFRQRYFVGE